MEPVIVVGGARVFAGDCREVLKHLPDNSVDSVVTDPPYELGFMGKSWDSSGIAYDPAVWLECLRVLKPGGHILAFGGSRTWHRLAVAVEDAGFELRDSIAWIYGSGFPKSLDVSKAIDKKLGAEREVVATGYAYGMSKGQEAAGYRPADYESKQLSNEAITPKAQQWQGWGSALKPAFEPVVVGRKPFGKGVTVAENVLEWGVGGLNIDGSRIGSESRVNTATGKRVETVTAGGSFGGESGGYNFAPGNTESVVQGRWPANVILDEVSAGLLDEQSGVSRSGKPGVERIATSWNANTYGVGIGKVSGQQRGDFGDRGGASRFFYVAKASKRDRNEGLEELRAEKLDSGSYGINSDKGVASRKRNPDKQNYLAQNFHPTVKPTALMRYLIKLVTPLGGTVLDPFTGSGSTGKAALLDGFDFVGVELTEEYLPIIEGRLRWASEQVEDDGTLF
jgi:site-specific DNA-methyltransferase (adenine-specific)